MTNTQRSTLTRLVTGSILFFLLLRLSQHATLSGILAPPLFAAELDMTYWIYKTMRIPDLIVNNRAGAIIFDCLLFSTGILSFLYPLQRKWIIPFSVLLFFYVITFCGFATHHLGQVFGYMVVLLPFWVADNYKFSLAWEGMRYLTCLVYTLAFAWKIFLGNSFYFLQQGAGSFKANLVDYIYLNPDNLLTHFYEWWLRHEWLLNAGDKLVIILEGVMVIGFFTRKHDKVLIWIPVFIHVATYFFSDVFFIELLVIDLSLLSCRQLDRIGEWFNGLALKMRGMAK